MEELVAPLLTGVSCADGGARSVPLTTPDLHLLLERMQVRTEETKDRVYATLKGHYGDFVELVEQAGVAASNVDDVYARVMGLLGDEAFQTGLYSFESKLWSLSAEIKTMRSELNVKTSALSLVKRAAALRSGLLAGKETFFNGGVVEGATKISVLKEPIMEYDRSSLIMFSLLRHLWSEVFSQVESVLTDLFSQAVDNDGILAIKSVSFAGAQITLLVIFEAMEVLGLLDGVMNKFSDALCKLLTILIREPCLELTVDDEHATLWMSTCKTNEKQDSTVEQVYDRVLCFLRFVHKHVVNHREVWMQKLGVALWPRLADMIIQNHLRKAIPKDHTEFQHFETIQTLTSEFEHALYAENFITINEHNSRLSSFTSDVEFHFSSNERNRLLSRARRLIVEFDYSLILKMIAKSEANDQLLLREDKYVVSCLSRQLLSIVHETLKDACSSTPRIALELYKTSRDVMFLFRAIVSLQFDKSALQAAPIFYNDCLFIADELVKISEQYSELLPGDLRQSCTFVDLVPLFQTMSSYMLSEHFKSLSNQLMQILDDARGFMSTDERHQRETTECALQQVVCVLQTVHITWHECLPKPVEARQLINLTTLVLQRVTMEILSIQDLAAEETVQLHTLLDNLMQELRPVLACVETLTRRRLERTIPLWQKLKCLSGILEMSLRPITKAWETGELSSAGFSSTEVQRLIKAIFTDTSLRTECLQRIL